MLSYYWWVLFVAWLDTPTEGKGSWVSISRLRFVVSYLWCGLVWCIFDWRQSLGREYRNPLVRNTLGGIGSRHDLWSVLFWCSLQGWSGSCLSGHFDPMDRIRAVEWECCCHYCHQWWRMLGHGCFGRRQGTGTPDWRLASQSKWILGATQNEMMSCEQTDSSFLWRHGTSSNDNNGQPCKPQRRGDSEGLAVTQKVVGRKQ